MQTDTETARSLLNGIDDSGLSSAAYARAIRNAYYRGMNGVKFEDTPGYSDAAKLPETQRRAAWEAGKQRRAAKVQEREALIDSGKAGTRESGVTMQESAKSIRNLNKQQQTGMAAAKALAAAGLHVGGESAMILCLPGSWHGFRRWRNTKIFPKRNCRRLPTTKPLPR